MDRSFQTNLFDEARPARLPILIAAVATYVLYGLFLQWVIEPSGLRSGFEATAVGRWLGFDLVLAWVGLGLEVGLILWLLGGLRPWDVGLRLGALPGALLAILFLWAIPQAIIVLIGAFHAKSDPTLADWWSTRSPGTLVHGVLGWTFHNAVLFRGFLLTQFYLWLGLGRFHARRPWLRWGIALLASQAAAVILHELARSFPAFGALTNVHVLEGWLKLFLIYGLCAWAYLRSGNLFYTIGVATLVNDPLPLFSFEPAEMPWGLVTGIYVAAVLVQTEWLHRRLVRRPYLDKAQLGDLPLPRRLGDPVLLFRVFLKWFLLLAILRVLFQFISGNGPDDRSLSVLLTLPITVFLLAALPNRRTNAFYLRAFRGDDNTADVRKAIQAALGNGYRLSGIRSPGHRWPQWLRSLNRWIFCLHYSSVRYMNLEANHDWLSRLWRSLADARCAFVDLADVTELVAVEIRLACRALGFERILFLGDKSRSIEAWQDYVAEHLQNERLVVKPGRVQVARWLGPDRADRREFMRKLEDFADSLPPGVAGLNWDAFPMVRSAVMTRRDRWKEAGHEVGTFLVGLVPVLALQAGTSVLSAIPSRVAQAGSLGIGLVVFVFLAAAILSYIRECPTTRQKTAASLWLVGLVLFYVGIVVMSLMYVSSMNREMVIPTGELQLRLEPEIERRSSVLDPLPELDMKGQDAQDLERAIEVLKAMPPNVLEPSEIEVAPAPLEIPPPLLKKGGPDP
jgi:hypothetical protein